jgi:hypothetical protein
MALSSIFPKEDDFSTETKTDTSFVSQAINNGTVSQEDEFPSSFPPPSFQDEENFSTETKAI